MVHVRLNEKESNPNPHINFISTLPYPDDGSAPSAEDAKELLKALAAQVKPIMKDHGFVINSFEEYEYNRVFAGRNWNAGECVEIVLRKPDGSFFGTDMLLSTLTHELAHIRHMHHLAPFQKLWAQLRREVQTLQNKGYFGDGFWSSGQRLRDSLEAQGKGVGGAADVLPEYVCGGAHSQKRSGYMKTRRVRRPKKEAVPSLHTGAQTAKKRKPGGRLTKVLPGEGQKLAEEGGSKGKQANSKRAREERAAAVERRLKGVGGELNLQSAAQSSYHPLAASSPAQAEDHPVYDLDEEDSDLEPEDDNFRRGTMKEVVDASELEGLKWSNSVVKNHDQSHDSKHGVKRPVDTEIPSSSTGEGTKRRRTGITGLVTDEIAHRNKEKLGLTGSGRKVGSGRPLESFFKSQPSAHRSQTPIEVLDGQPKWTCSTCTLINDDGISDCAACGGRRPS